MPSNRSRMNALLTRRRIPGVIAVLGIALGLSVIAGLAHQFTTVIPTLFEELEVQAPLTFQDEWIAHIPSSQVVGSKVVSLTKSWSSFLESSSSTARPEGKTPRCGNNWNCSLDNHCFATEEGICYAAPDGIFIGKKDPLMMGRLSRRRLPRGGTDATELECSWMPEAADTLPDILVPNCSSNNHPRDHVNNFKLITGAGFQRWYDWDAPISEVANLPLEKIRRRSQGAGFGPAMNMHGQMITSSPSTPLPTIDDPPSHRFQFSSGHDLQDPNRLYKMKHVCVRPSGKLSGFRPIVGAWNGGSEVTAVVQQWNKEQEKYQHEWVQSIEPLAEEPTWYLDHKLIIVPMFGEWSVHPGHAMQRMGNVVWNVDAAFPRTGWDADHPDWARKDVTTMFTHVWTPPHQFTSIVRPPFRPTCNKDCVWEDYGFKAYTTLATRGHFMTMTHRHHAYKTFLERTPAGRRADVSPEKIFELEKAFEDHPVCFKEAVVWQACYWPDCNNNQSKAHQWPLYGWRAPKTQQKIARRFRACVGVEHLARHEAKKDMPLVLHSYRSFGKHLQRSEMVAGRVHSLVQKYGGTLKILKLKNSVIPLVTLYSQVDIIVSPYGSGLLYSFVAPPGTVGVEISHASVHPGASVGINRLSEIDYTSQFKAGSGYLMAASMKEHEARYHTAISTPLGVMDRMMDAAYCGLKNHNGEEAHVLDLCQFNESMFKNEIFGHRTDVSGRDLRSMLRKVVVDNDDGDYKASAAHLVAMHHYSQQLAPVFYLMRQTVTKMLLIYDLTPPKGGAPANSGPDYSALLRRLTLEIEFYRSHLSENVRIFLVFTHTQCNDVKAGPSNVACRHTPGDEVFFAQVQQVIERFYSPGDVAITKQWATNPDRSGMPPRYTGEIHRCGVTRLSDLGGGVPPLVAERSFPADHADTFVNNLHRTEGGDVFLLQFAMSGFDLGTACAGGLKDPQGHHRFELAIVDGALLRSPRSLQQVKKMMREDRGTFIVGMNRNDGGEQEEGGEAVHLDIIRLPDGPSS